MKLLPGLQCCLLLLGALAAGPSHADSLASSASSAGSASSDSVSNSLHRSSNSSSGGDHRADVDYRVIEVGSAPDRPGVARLALQETDSPETVYLDLPLAIAAGQRLARGDLVHAHRQVYGLAFARADASQPFFLVLDDDWFDGLAARPVKL